MAPKAVRQAAAWMGRKGYRARVAKYGLERIAEIARENGKRGGRPKGRGKKKGAKS